MRQHRCSVAEGDSERGGHSGNPVRLRGLPELEDRGGAAGRWDSGPLGAKGPEAGVQARERGPPRGSRLRLTGPGRGREGWGVGAVAGGGERASRGPGVWPPLLAGTEFRFPSWVQPSLDPLSRGGRRALTFPGALVTSGKGRAPCPPAAGPARFGQDSWTCGCAPWTPSSPSLWAAPIRRKALPPGAAARGAQLSQLPGPEVRGQGGRPWL